MENRNHTHVFSTTVATDSVSFAGVDGCCNDSPAGSGTYDAHGGAESAPSNLPYIQMLTCISMFETFDVNVPDNTLLFNPLTGCAKVSGSRGADSVVYAWLCGSVWVLTCSCSLSRRREQGWQVRSEERRE